MEHLQSLPVREPPLPGESLASLLRRTAVVMGYDNVNLLTRLLGEGYRPHQSPNLMPPGPHLDRLATLLRLPSEDLLQRTVHCFAPVLVLRPAGSPVPSLCDSKTTFRFFVLQSSPACPVCLAEASSPHEQLIWLLQPLRVCTRHGCLLLYRCPSCQRVLPSSRKSLAHCPCGVSLPECRPTNVSAATLTRARMLEDWFSADFQAVPQLAGPAVLWLVERLAAAVAKTPRWAQLTADRLEIDPAGPPELLCWTAAVEAVESWPENFWLFLDELQRSARDRTPDRGVSHPFGTLLRDAAHLEELGYPAPALALRKYLLERYTTGHVNGKVVLFHSAESRCLLRQGAWYTQTEAADALQLRQGTVVELVRRGVLEGEIRPAGSRGRSIGVVSKRSVEVLRRSLDTGLSVSQVRRRLGIGRSQVLDLIHAGLLGTPVRTRKGWIVPLEAVQDLASIQQSLPSVGPDRRSWLPLRQVTRAYGSCGLNLVQALKLVREGKVRARTDGHSLTLRSLWLSQPDVEAQLPLLLAKQYEASGYPLSVLAKVLLPGHPSREPVLKKWIRAGLLHVQRQGRTWTASPAEVERFRAEYCLADEACALLQVSRSTLSRWERSGRLTPVYGKRTCRGAGFSLYRRQDLPRRLRKPGKGCPSHHCRRSRSS